jgi:hypothetical protein
LLEQKPERPGFDHKISGAGGLPRRFGKIMLVPECHFFLFSDNDPSIRKIIVIKSQGT